MLSNRNCTGARRAGDGALYPAGARDVDCLPRVIAAMLLTTVLLAGCQWLRPVPEPGIGDPVSWDRLPGWHHDQQAEAWPALLASCQIRGDDPRWEPLCSHAAAMETPDDATARRFFESWFQPHRVHGPERRDHGLVTGYYEPLLRGSLEPDERFYHPLYRAPEDLLIVDLGSLYPALQGRRVRARLEGNRVVPYFDRAEIDSERPLEGQELLWVDDPVDAFFLQIQGSGRVELPDGRLLAVGYADQNGHPYVAIGRTLVRMGELEADEVTLFSIRQWLRDHPQRAEEVLNSNPSYIFFQFRDAPERGPFGAMNVALTPQRSIAVDPEYVPLGTPVWLDTTLPGPAAAPWQRLTLAQDTGGAIRGAIRVDVFFGRGEEAERLAGTMRQDGRVHVLLPREPEAVTGP
jgi:membrane-bound lytic murein transglycosylase A